MNWKNKMKDSDNLSIKRDQSNLQMIETLSQAKFNKRSNKLMMKSLMKFKADWQLSTQN